MSYPFASPSHQQPGYCLFGTDKALSITGKAFQQPVLLQCAENISNVNMIFFQINSARNCLKLAQNVFRVLTCSFHWCRTSWWHNSCYRRRLYCPCYPPSHRKGTRVDLADDLCLRTPGEVPLRRSRPWPGAGTCPSRWFVLCYSRSPREGAVQSTRKHSDVTWAPGRLKSPTYWLFVFVQ